MNTLREWLFAVTVSALAVTLAGSLTPEGTVKKLGGLVGGMLLLLVMLRPVTQWRLTMPTAELLTPSTESGDSYTEEPLKTIIEEKVCAYIVDKGAELGITCNARVTAEKDESGWFVPREAEVIGVSSGEARSILGELLTRELNIPTERQYFREVAP